MKRIRYARKVFIEASLEMLPPHCTLQKNEEYFYATIGIHEPIS